MSASTPPLAPVVVLLFLGTSGLIGFSILTFLIGAARRSTLLTAIGGATASGVATAYSSCFAVSHD